MNARRAARRARLVRDNRAAALVEFALIAPPMLLLLIGGMDVAYTSYIRIVLQGALGEAARKATVENPQMNRPGLTLAAQVENLVKETVSKVAAGADIKVSQRSFFDFSRIGNPEKLTFDKNKNGKYDAADKDCWEDANRNGTFDTNSGVAGRGYAGEVVFYKADLSMPRLFPLHIFLPVPPTVDLSFETAVRNQPFEKTPTPPVLCGP